MAALASGLVLGALFAPAALGFELGMEGELDSSFGQRGSVSTPARFAQPWSQARVQLARGPEGDLVEAAGETILRFLPDGQPDGAFGGAGRVSVALPPGWRFKLGDLAVDPEGRVVAIGTAVNEGSSLRPAPSFAAVLRYLPDGEPDPSFGGDGVVMRSFGLAVPARQRAARVTGSLGAVDGEGRISLVVGTVQSLPSCGGPPRPGQRDRLIARLTSAGKPDPSFGRGGVATIGPLATVSALTFDRRGGAVLAGPLPQSCGGGPRFAVVRLGPGGSRKSGFGTHGVSPFRGTAPVAVAVDHSDRVVVLCRSHRMRFANEHDAKILRLLPSGRLDPSFSGGWLVYEFEGPSYRWSSLVVDSRERPVLVGTLIKFPSRHGKRIHRWIVLMRLKPDGKSETHFGWQGWLAFTRFDFRSDATGSEALLDPEGRLLVAGTAVRPELDPGGGFVLARFLLSYPATPAGRGAGGPLPRAFRGGPPSPSPPSAAAPAGRRPRR